MAVLNEELAAQAASLSRSTVQVHRRSGGGSGVIWDSNGLIVTNAHVVSMGARVELSDKRVFDAVCIKRDRCLDLAILKVDATDLPAATIGNSDALRVGELVLAVGNPLGAVGALTTGIIHAVSPLNTPNKWVQADIRLAPGNSGGPLADAQGRAIGINTVIVGGLALAVPSNTVKRFLSQERSRPYLGVTLQPIIISQIGGRGKGFLLLKVEQGSLAQSAGLLVGDVLIGVAKSGGVFAKSWGVFRDGVPPSPPKLFKTREGVSPSHPQLFKTAGKLFRATTDLAQALWQTNPGEELQLDFLREGKYMTCTVQMPDGKTSAEAA